MRYELAFTLSVAVGLATAGWGAEEKPKGRQLPAGKAPADERRPVAMDPSPAPVDHCAEEKSPPADEEWECDSKVENRSGTIDSTRCKDAEKRVACYEDLKVTCVEKRSGRRYSRRDRVYNGVCVSDFANCW